MTNSSDNDLKFFENLDDLVIDETTDQRTASVGRTEKERDRPKRSVPTLTPAGLHVGASQKSGRISEDDVVDLLQSPTSHPSQQGKATNCPELEASMMPVPQLASTAAPPSATLKPERSSVSSRPVPSLPWRWLVGFMAVAMIGCVAWYLSHSLASASPQPFQGTIRFEGTVPPAAFIQLFKLNSPREEDYVTEIRDSQFVFPDVSPGDYALWLATVERTPIPVRPVGASVGVLTEAEHHLRISLNGKSGPLVLELSAVRRAK